jgi:predicted Zn-dependent peptidase
VTVEDIFDFLAAYFNGQPAADFNGVGGVTVQDIFDYLAAYFVGC